VTRTTGWIARGALVLWLILGCAPGALACWQCDGPACVVAEGGARACFYGVHGCTTFGSCAPEAGPSLDGGMALQLTWLETGGPAAGPRVLRGAGRRVFGAAAVRVHRAAAGDGAPAATVVAAIAGFGEAFAVSLGGDRGDGVAIEWAAEGRGGRVVVRALRGGAPGETLADERLADSDALLVPALHAGRAYALVVEPRVLPRLSVRLESADLVRTARDAVRPGHERLDLTVAALP
jgi:hypothetical protein